MDTRRHAIDQAARAQQLAFQAQSMAQQAFQAAQQAANLSAQAAQCCQTVVSAASEGQVTPYATFGQPSPFAPSSLGQPSGFAPGSFGQPNYAPHPEPARTW